MSIVITIVSNIAVLVSHNIIFFEFFMHMSHGVNKKTPSSASSHLHPPARFSPGLLVVLQEILYQPSFAEENKIFPFSSLMVGFDFAVLFMCIFYDSFFYSFAIMKYESRAVVVFSDSEKTKFEVDTTSVILSYLYRFGNVKKELFRYC